MCQGLAHELLLIFELGKGSGQQMGRFLAGVLFLSRHVVRETILNCRNCVLLFTFLFATVTTAQATPVTVVFSGHGLYTDIACCQSVVFGGSFTIDLSLVDTNPDPKVGTYFSSLPSQFIVIWTGAGRTGGADIDDETITITNAHPGDASSDTFVVTGFRNNLFEVDSFQLVLYDAAQTAIKNDHLFLPNFSKFTGGYADFGHYCWTFSFCQNPASLSGDLTSFVVQRSIPEPGSLPLLIFGLGIAALYRWRVLRSHN